MRNKEVTKYLVTKTLNGVEDQINLELRKLKELSKVQN